MALGWPKLTRVSHTVFFWPSMQYQIRPDPVTSYCHCSISTRLTRYTRREGMEEVLIAVAERSQRH